MEKQNPLDLLKRVFKYVDFIQYIFSSLECQYENDDDVIE
jgi:hypothetical protein